MKDDKAASNNGTHQKNQHNDVSSATQRAQILSYLKAQGSATTLDLRNELHILSPAPRILELREQGYRIVTVRENQVTPDGKKHLVARYILGCGYISSDTSLA
ncbi:MULTISPECIES: helix-turn-helix domain-containing protein [unclassified Colwellia]|uniref:helix-turn-helix domain-containing protein n=1 Tax=unclassified Colwellia TaxID=196834 RepID=UPI0015F7164F|nr:MULTISPECIES: helix-turn-helix domain-containing protein [unclassified Colwellia]MBA6234066.1 helix-turn-helix domain-containing protein [Colwellia sp. MB02u-7]MBA6238012.1 helix-turn-helix domain-containing protein [Colwellia sp. MB02u-11]MBA6300740.1 helix-turn-helix domain-containing protein [Colwellia sp. MB3u-22]MBA6311361.1 helix-turn-helix domain-containing protein [Colwellia sp. MB3u-64]